MCILTQTELPTVYEKGMYLSAGLSAADSPIAFKLNRVGLESARLAGKP